MIQIRLTRPQNLKPAQLALWDRLQREQQDLESPYFRPEFTQAVAAVRSDVEVAVIEEDGKPAGFFPFQRSPLNLGQPVGGRLNDFHGLILPRGFRIDARQLLRATRLASWDFDHLVGDQPSLAAFQTRRDESACIDISQGFAAWCDERKKAGTEVVRKTQSRERKFEREIGPLRFELRTSKPEQLLETLIAWKVAQFERTGFMNLFSFEWTSRLLRSLLTGNASLTGMISALWHGDQPVAISYRLRSFHVAHEWFIAYNVDYATYSPGMVLMLRVLEASFEQGITRLHLGSGDQRFKESLANGSVPVGVGTIERATPSTMLRDAWRWGREAAEASPFLARCKQAPAALLKPVRSWLAFR
jgi:CelD/BcsL family acetyltransferase involved in cellulose biosynthesis